MSIATLEARWPVRVAALVVGPVLVPVLLVLLGAKSAYAKTFTVNHKGDATDDVPGDGSCNAGFGLASSATPSSSTEGLA